MHLSNDGKILQGTVLIMAGIKWVQICRALKVKYRTIHPELVHKGKLPPSMRDVLVFTVQQLATLTSLRCIIRLRAGCLHLRLYPEELVLIYELLVFYL
jgi:hypothetical protein